MKTNIAPGEGPSKETRDNGFFWIDYIAKANVDGKEIACRGKVGSDKGDCGYKETAKVRKKAFASQSVATNQPIRPFFRIVCWASSIFCCRAHRSEVVGFPFPDLILLCMSGSVTLADAWVWECCAGEKENPLLVFRVHWSTAYLDHPTRNKSIHREP